MLSAPLRDRFQIREHLGFYDVADLAEIVRRNARKLKVRLDAAAAEMIAKRCRGTPRVANNLLRWLRDYADSRANGHITTDVANAALKMAGVDDLGLGPHERQYLETLMRVFSGGPAGIEAIAHTMNVAVDTLTDDVEPFLLRSELLVRTPRGRTATAKAYNHLKKSPPNKMGDDDQSPLFD
jgi:Holliday junction DNA helicase RuvB